MNVLLVDWLGRGGIAQTSETWARVLDAAGHRTEVVTRPGRELRAGAVRVSAPALRRGRLAMHRAVAQTAADRIRAGGIDVLVLQNYVAPMLETRVVEAAHHRGVRVVQVVHDHRLHTVRAGTRVGMKRRLRDADVVVAHSTFVAEGIAAFAGRADVDVVPFPLPLGLLDLPPRLPSELSVRREDEPLLCCGHFGVLRRRYKGTSVVERLAREPTLGWRFAAAGVGAPPASVHLASLDRFLDADELVAFVGSTDVTLAPYRFATQSAVVVVAHLLGSVPVASAVGGIPEQVADTVDGLLVAPDAPIEVWRDALVALRDDDTRKAMAVEGTARAWRDHDAFVTWVRKLVA
jgi:glycosyltransferase involved in cell wall biosynthesis